MENAKWIGNGVQKVVGLFVLKSIYVRSSTYRGRDNPHFL